MRGAAWPVLLMVGAVVVLLSACGDDDEQLVVEPAVSPTARATPVSSATVTADRTATVSTSATPTAGTPTAIALTPTPTPTPVDVARFLGVYDVSFDAEFRTSDAIAEVSMDGDEVEIVWWSDGHGFLSLQGTPTADGRVTLDGLSGVPNDFFFPVEGTARFAEMTGRQQIRGSSTSSFAANRPFVLDRPVLRESSPFDGTYRFAFEPSPGGCRCSTSATLTIGVDENGVGASTLAADELDAGENRQGTFDPGECLVTTRGRLRCVLGYETTFVPMQGQPPAGPRFRVTLMGVLSATGNTMTGEGRADAPIFPQVYFLGGDWTATRLAP